MLQARLVALQLRVQGLGRELGLVRRLGGAGEVDEGVRVGPGAQLLQALEDVVVVGAERAGPHGGVAAERLEVPPVDADLGRGLGAARRRAGLPDVLLHGVDIDLADDLGDAVGAAHVLARDGLAEGRDAAFAAGADVGGVGVGLGDDEVAVRRARGEEALDGGQYLGVGLELGGVGG